MTRTNKIIGIVSAILAAATFGMIPLFSIPLMDAGMSEASILFYRCLFSAAAIGITCAAGKKSIRISRNSVFKLSGMSLIYTSTAMALIYSYNYISSGVVTTIHFLYPVIVALLMSFLYKEKVSGRLMAAALATLAGVGLLSWTSSGFSSVKGVILALSTALTYALYIVGLNQKGIKEVDSKVVILYILSFCTVIFGTIAYLTQGGIDAIPNGSSWVNILLLALVPTIISNMALVKAVKYAGATTTSILGSAEPLVAVILGVVIFSESLSTNGVIGLLVIISSVTYVIIASNRKETTAKETPPHSFGSDQQLVH